MSYIENIGKLMIMAKQLNAPDFHVFVDYSGHVDSLRCYVHLGGWKTENDEVTSMRVDICDNWGDITDQAVRQAIVKLRRMHRCWRSKNSKPVGE